VLSEAILVSAALVRSVSIPGTEMDVKLATQVGQPYDAAAVQRDVRTLWNLGRFSDVRVETQQTKDGGVNVFFRVVTEPRYGLHEVRFEPHSFGMQQTVQPGTIFTRMDAAKLAATTRSQLAGKGYNDAEIDWRFKPISHGQYDLIFKITPGKQGKRQPKEPPLPEAPRAICECLFEQRREAEYRGILDFNASLDENGQPHVELGKPYILRRLTFYGNHHYSDGLIRSHFSIDEGDSLDLFKLRQSVVRLNQAGLFEPVDEKQVHVASNEETGTADVTIFLNERKRHSWNFSGPLPVAASIAGKVIGTYGLSFHLLAFDTILKLATNKKVLPVFAIDKAFTPGEGWKSGLSFAPQLGWQGTVLGYASTQLTQRLVPRLMGTRAPDLAVASGDKTLLCKYPKPRFYVVRVGSSMVLRFAGQIGGLM
jgi:outer membrane protein assembly factor BamA